jgi:DNA-binding NarL/FixJ family response regulator
MRQACAVLADRHSTFLGAIRRLFENEIEIVLMVGDENSLYHALANFNPDLVVADLSFPVSTGINVAWVLKQRFPRIKVIILSMYDEQSVLDDVIAAGVEGYVLKCRAVIDLIPAIHELFEGHKYISPDIGEAL